MPLALVKTGGNTGSFGSGATSGAGTGPDAVVRGIDSTVSGALVLAFFDVREGGWYVHGVFD